MNKLIKEKVQLRKEIENIIESAVTGKQERSSEGVALEIMAKFDQALAQAKQEGREEVMAKVEKNIGMLRQWLNEDKITDRKLVTNADLEDWIFNNLKNKP